MHVKITICTHWLFGYFIDKLIHIMVQFVLLLKGDVMDTHGILCSLLESLGYKENNNGCCNGASLRWLEACLNNEEPIFANRMSYILAHAANLPKTIKKTKAKKGRQLDQYDEYLLDILAFLESIDLYQNVKKHKDILNITQEALRVEFEENYVFYAGSESTRNRGGLKKLNMDVILFSQLELKTYLDQLGALLNSLDTTQPIGIHLGNTMHAIGLSYSKKEGWKIMNIDTYPPEQFGLEQTASLVEKIYSGFNHDHHSDIVLDFSVITSADYPYVTELKNKLTQLHSDYGVTKDKAIRGQKVFLAHYFARYNCVKHIQKLASFGYDLNQSWNAREKVTPLHVAALHGCVDSVQVLIDSGVDLNSEAQGGVTPIEVAVEEGKDTIIGMLAHQGVPINKKNDNNSTLVHLAANYGYDSTVDTLVGLGLDVNATNDDLLTPVHLGALSGNPKVIDTLAKHHAQLNVPNSNNQTPLGICTANGYSEVFDALIRRGALINLGSQNLDELAYSASLSGHIQMIHTLRKYGLDIHKVSAQGESLAYYGVFSGSIHFLLEMIRLGVDCSIPYISSEKELEEMLLNAGSVAVEESHLRFLIKDQLKKGETRDAISVTPCDVSFLIDKLHLGRLIRKNKQIYKIYQPINELLNLGEQFKDLATEIKDALDLYLSTVFSEEPVGKSELTECAEAFKVIVQHAQQEIYQVESEKIHQLLNELDQEFKIFETESFTLASLIEEQEHDEELTIDAFDADSPTKNAPDTEHYIQSYHSFFQTKASQRALASVQGQLEYSQNSVF